MFLSKVKWARAVFNESFICRIKAILSLTSCSSELMFATPAHGLRNCNLSLTSRSRLSIDCFIFTPSCVSSKVNLAGVRESILIISTSSPAFCIVLSPFSIRLLAMSSFVFLQDASVAIIASKNIIFFILIIKRICKHIYYIMQLMRTEALTSASAVMRRKSMSRGACAGFSEPRVTNGSPCSDFRIYFTTM